MIKDEYFKAVASGGGSTPVGADLTKSGQTTVHRTGDDADSQAGREVDFYTLEVNNPFGNTNRFTDEVGTQTYTNNIVIDWSTYNNISGKALGYYRTLLSSNNWANQIDACLALSVSTFTSGWRLVNIKEINNIHSFGDSLVANRFDAFRYAPFNINIGNYVWTSTSRDASFAIGYLINPFGSFEIPLLNKGNSYQCIACRDFTVTGTTLT